MGEPVQEYVGENVTITYDPMLCIKAGECVRGLPAVFGHDPWAQPDLATPDEIATVIHRCPSGALKYDRRDGGPNETPHEPSISVQKNGPYYLRGDLRITDHRGNVLREDTRAALCRCGRSSNKPYCDGTHNTFAFEG